MNTQQLIQGLVADLQSNTVPVRHPPIWCRLAAMTGVASLVSLAAILLVLSRSPHLSHGPTATVIFTALAGMTLAAGAYWAVLQLSYPEGRKIGRFGFLLSLTILIFGIGLELSHTPLSTWSQRLWGDDPLACFLCVTALSLPLLAAVLVALRAGAPSQPQAAGAMAGLLAGGITAAIYTIHCPENSLLFIGAWHVLAILTVTFCGALAAPRFLRW